tara:strand:+ start:5984 stop:6607 length:624 start_codon:yes stop_codon:yes gene_type:complete
MIHVDPPFDLGETLKGTDDDGNLINEQWAGAVYQFPDVDRTPALRGGKSRRSGHVITAICLRNVNAAAELACASKLMKIDLSPTANSGDATAAAVTATYFNAVDALATTATGELVVVGDPELADVVLKNDLFWCIIKGPAQVAMKTGSDIAVGDLIGDSNVEGLAAELTPASGDTIATNRNVIGRAMQANADTAAGATINVLVNINL